MTFKKFKVLLDGVNSGDNKVPEDEKLLPLLNEAMKKIARKTKPLILRTTDKEDEMLCPMDNSKYFIRKPLIIQRDDDELDIDEALEWAVIYQTSIFYCHKKNKQENEDERDKVINEYNWMLYYTLRGMENEC